MKEKIKNLLKGLVGEPSDIELKGEFSKGDTNKMKGSNNIVASDNAKVKQINNSGTITQNYNFNDADRDALPDDNIKKERGHDEILYREYIGKLSFDELESYLDTVVSTSYWSAEVNKKVWDFLDLFTKDATAFFFDEGLEKRRCRLVDACKKYGDGICIESGTYYGADKYSLRDEVINHEKLQKSLDKIIPLAKELREAYLDFVIYAKKNMKFV